MNYNSELQKFNKPLKDSSRQRLGEPASYHLLARYKVHLNLVSLMQIAEVVVGDISVLGSLMHMCNLDQGQSGLIVPSELNG